MECPIILLRNILYEARHYQTIIGAFIAAFIAWKYNKSNYKLNKENAKRQLFQELNTKYDSINDYLEELVHLEFETELKSKNNGSQNLDELWEELINSPENAIKKTKVLTAAFDYINLCSEQYYWYKKGFIDENVWICWAKGMKDWSKNSFFISKIIQREKKQNASYYNDDFLDLFNN